jgi:riboflavin kinase/FMN adenylyltransferase
MISFTTTTTSGHGRGKTLGFPTLNMVIPEVMKQEKHGIYAATIELTGKKRNGALYFGPPITFGDTTDQLEVYILDEDDLGAIEKNIPVTVSLLGFVRGVETFKDADSLIEQMHKDVAEVRSICSAQKNVKVTP